MNRHLKPRTIKEWLELIPFDRARREALENISCIDIEVNSLSKALGYSFRWANTVQGYDYWENLYDAICNMEQSIKLK